ncbi:hypothetical protein V1505DRAFT_377387 [Lipomyces doorenjongii]
MAGRRAIGRTVYLYHFPEPDKQLGGLKLNPSVTENIFLSMLGILIKASGQYSVILRSTGHTLSPIDNALHPGHYDIRPHSRKDTISITNEPCILRIISQSSTGKDHSFRREVRQRDGKCVITGVVNTEAAIDEWSGFHAAHIFPRSSEDYFVQSGFSRWITNRSGNDTGINSCQNGLLMQSTIHEKFDGYFFPLTQIMVTR